MKRIYILILAALMLTSCDFFMKPINFKGDKEESKLVLTAHLEAGKTPRIYLNSSIYILNLNKVPKDTIKSTYDEDTPVFPRCWVKDAEVKMQINDGPWQSLTCVSDTCYNYAYRYCIYYEPVYYYQNDYVFQPGDTVRFQASHPDYPTVTASQTIPQYPKALFEVEKYAQRNQYDGLVELSITLPPYTGNETDVLNFKGCSYTRNTTINGNQDTSTYYFYEKIIYSRGLGFANYENVNTKLSLDYWGAASYGLFHNANRQNEEVTFPIRAYYSPYFENNTGFRGTDSIVVEAKMVTQDYYRNVASLEAGGYYNPYVPDYWYSNSGDDYFDMQEIINDIQESFAELGNLEGVQVFCNIDGGYGYVVASATDRLVIGPIRE